MALKCPRDGTEMAVAEQHLRDLPHEHCPKCDGAWFDLSQFTELEAKTGSEAALTGTLEFDTRPDAINCPVCGKPMTAFDFHGQDLELDACSAEHGFWLDADEAKRVESIMRQRSEDIERSAHAEGQWNRERERGFSRDLLDQLRHLIGG